MAKKKIPLEIIPNAYDISKLVYEGRIRMSDGARQLASNYNMNLSSAKDYIYDFEYLRDGKKFTRELNIPSMRYFIEHIFADYGNMGLSNALLALDQHIKYNKNRKVPVKAMQDIYDEYLGRSLSPVLIENLDNLLKNIETLENYLTEGNNIERLEASKLIKQGICFVAYKVGKELRFAPSRFLGYIGNNLERHSLDHGHGTYTNNAISGILDSEPRKSLSLEKKYFNYCNKLGIKPDKKGRFGAKRKFWSYNLSHDFQSNIEQVGEFPEGKIVERSHKSRERNSKVIGIAKENFKRKHGKLFCQICQFDFESKYGTIGRDFIEGHHTIAVSDMLPGHITLVSDIAMLCSNCHRMVHKKRPWLEMKDLKKLILKNISK